MANFLDSWELRQDIFDFGRHPNFKYPLIEAKIPDGFYNAISRTHFRIEKRTDPDDIHGSEVVLHDFSSLGTFVNGEKVGKGLVNDAHILSTSSAKI